MSTPAAVAVVSWNTRELLGGCLRALRADADAGRAEVWVVDNGSTDGSPELVADAFPWVRLERPATNLGFGAAVNLVAARTATPFVVPANADVAVEPGALAALLAAAERHGRAGAFAPRLLLQDGATQPTLHPFPGVGVGLVLSLGLGRIARVGRALALDGAWDPAAGREADWADGALLLVRREAWDAVGGFDASQWLYAEDLDLCWRLRRAGWTTRYVPAARAAHAAGAATGARWDPFARDLRTQRSAYAWMLARQGPVRTRATALAHLAGPLVASRALRSGASLAGRRGASPTAARWTAAADRHGAWAAMHRTGLEPAAALDEHRRRPG